MEPQRSSRRGALLWFAAALAVFSSIPAFISSRNAAPRMVW